MRWQFTTPRLAPALLDLRFAECGFSVELLELLDVHPVVLAPDSGEEGENLRVFEIALAFAGHEAAAEVIDQ